ncbi:MAG: hypothetical protein LBR30_04155 [Clostridioides sp.]|jgi:hydrogenase-4 membrane subunit HyfE|nr:hypothetical protein [Clostridioides sp.]
MKKSKLLLISSILGVLYVIYIVCYFGGVVGNTSQSDAEMVGSTVATMLVLPHIFLTLLAVIFNIIGYCKNGRGFTLTAAILYAVAGFIFIMYAMFVLPSMILSFVGYAKLKDISEINKAIQDDINRSLIE